MTLHPGEFEQGIVFRILYDDNGETKYEDVELDTEYVERTEPPHVILRKNI